MFRTVLLLLTCLPSVLNAATEIERLEKSVVRVITVTAGGYGVGSGSVVADGRILTNEHVIRGGQKFYVISRFIQEEREKGIPAKVLWQDRALDLAVLSVDELSLPAVTLSVYKPRKGEPVWALGYPRSSDYNQATFEATVNRGVVSLFHSSPWIGSGSSHEVDIIQHDAAINPGNSGGPLFDDCGRVIGVNTQKNTKADGTFLASRITEAVSELRRLGIDFQAVNTPCASSVSVAQEEAQAAQESAAEAKDTARQVQDKVEAIGRQGLALGVVLVVLVLVAIALALRKPRQEIIKVVERMSTVLSRGHRPKTVTDRKTPAPALVLTGFDTAGCRQQLVIPSQGLMPSEGGFVIGRHMLLADGILNDSNVSRRHARILMAEGSYQIEDLNSSNGTSINGRLLNPFCPEPIRPGDTLAFGKVKLTITSGV